MTDTFLLAMVLTILAIIMMIFLYLVITGIFNKSKGHRKAFLMSQIDSESTGQTLTTEYIKFVGNDQIVTEYAQDIFSLDVLGSILNNIVTNLTVVNQVCQIGQKNCTTIVKFLYKEHWFFMSTNSHKVDFLDDENRPVWSSEVEDLIEVLDDNGRLATTNTIQLCYGTNVPKDVVQEVHNTIFDSQLDYIEYPMEITKVKMYQLAIGPFGLYKQRYNRTISNMGKEYYDVAYSEPEIEFNGESHKLPMNDVLEIATYSLMNGENLYIFGNAGTGKTFLMEELAAQCVKEGATCIQVTPNTISELKGLNGISQLRKALSEELEEGVRTVLIIDEAERLLSQDNSGVHTDDAAFMLQLTSGSFQRDFNLSVVLAFNANPATLNQSLFRRGRSGMTFNLTPISAAKADKAITILKNALPGKVFNQNQYRKLLETENRTPNGSIYAFANEITLADLYSCFIDIDKTALIINKLRKKAGLSIPQAVDVEPAPTESKPAPQQVEATIRRIVVPEAVARPVEPSAAPVTINSYKKNKKKKHRR